MNTISESQLRRMIRRSIIKEIESASDLSLDIDHKYYSHKDKNEKHLDSSISDGVNFGQGSAGIKRRLAWKQLSSSGFLPIGTVLTSAFRTQIDQDRIIINYAKSVGIDYSNLDSAHKELTNRGFIISRKVGKGHGGISGVNAFDLSGANLNQIENAVIRFNNESSSTEVPTIIFDKITVEDKNNAVHIEYDIRTWSEFNDSELEAALRD